jgi:hypothetical protein
MDELTRERWPGGSAWREGRGHKTPTAKRVEDWGLILERRQILNEALKNPGVSEHVQPPEESDPRDMVHP